MNLMERIPLATSSHLVWAVTKDFWLGSTTVMISGISQAANPCRYREPSWPAPTRRICAALVVDELTESKGNYGMILKGGCC